MNRTHRVDLYAPVTGGSKDEWGRASAATFSGEPVARGVECNLQPLTGSVRQAAAGREVQANWQGFLPAAAAIREDMGLVVTQIREDGVWREPPATHPRAFRVRQVGYQGERFDTEVLLGTTREAVPAA